MIRSMVPEFLTLPKLPNGWTWIRMVNYWAAEFHGKCVGLESGSICIIASSPAPRGSTAPTDVILAVMKANGVSL